MMSSFSSAKLVFDGEVRRFPLPEEQSLDVLMQSITKAFEAKLGARTGLHLEYTDDEEDLITVSSDAEFQEALSVFREQGARIPKFTVIRSQTEVRQPTPTNHSSNDAVHTGVCCDKCNMSPIIGFRYKCAVRKDYDICEGCEAQDDSPYPYLKIKTPEQAPAFIQIGLLGSESGSRTEDFAHVNEVSENYADVSVNKPNPIGFLTNVLEAVNKVAHNERERTRREKLKRRSQSSHKSSEETWFEPAAEPTSQSAEEPSRIPPLEVSQSSPPEVNLVHLQCVTSVHKDGPYFMVRDKDTVFLRPAGSSDSDGHLFMRRNGSVGIDAPKTHRCASWQIIEKENGTVSFKNKAMGLMLASVNGNLVGMQSTSSVPCTSFHLELLPTPFQPKPVVLETFQPKPTPPQTPLQAPTIQASAPIQEPSVQPKPTSDQTEVAPERVECCDASRLCAKFVSDATIPDGCSLPACARIQKTWRLRNECDIPFPSGCRLECIGGDLMGGPKDGIQVPVIQPWEEFNVTVPLSVPETLGSHKSLWRLRSPSGQHFGDQLWVSLISSSSPATSGPSISQTTQLHLPVPNGTRPLQPTTLQEPSTAGSHGGDWDALLDAELAEMCAESMKEEAPPQFSAQNPFLGTAGTQPRNAVEPPLQDSVPQKWRPAVEALSQMGFCESERSVAALDKWATPANWQDYLNAVINELVQEN